MLAELDKIVKELLLCRFTECLSDKLRELLSGLDVRKVFRCVASSLWLKICRIGPVLSLLSQLLYLLGKYLFVNLQPKTAILNVY